MPDDKKRADSAIRALKKARLDIVETFQKLECEQIAAASRLDAGESCGCIHCMAEPIVNRIDKTLANLEGRA